MHATLADFTPLQSDLFNDRYPVHAAARPTHTSRKAAVKVEKKCDAIRRKSKAILKMKDVTPDECAEEIGEHYLDVRPRFSEMKEEGSIATTGEERPSIRGNPMEVYRLITPF